MPIRSILIIFFFFNDTAPTEIYTLSLHDALPISIRRQEREEQQDEQPAAAGDGLRSEEHTSELQSRVDLVCRLLLEKQNLSMTTVTLHPTSTLVRPVTQGFIYL